MAKKGVFYFCISKMGGGRSLSTVYEREKQEKRGVELN
jgi:hypothetical protein